MFYAVQNVPECMPQFQWHISKHSNIGFTYEYHTTPCFGKWDQITCAYLSNVLSGVEPDEEVWRDDDDLTPVVLREDLEKKYSHLVERSESSSQGRVHRLVIELRVSSHPGDERLVPERRQLSGWAAGCNKKKHTVYRGSSYPFPSLVYPWAYCTSCLIVWHYSRARTPLLSLCLSHPMFLCLISRFICKLSVYLCNICLVHHRIWWWSWWWWLLNKCDIVADICVWMLT